MLGIKYFLEKIRIFTDNKLFLKKLLYFNFLFACLGNNTENY